MWNVFKYAHLDIVDNDGELIYPANTWFLMGTYYNLDAAKEVIEHEIELYNCFCKSDEPNPKFKIESNFDD